MNGKLNEDQREKWLKVMDNVYMSSGRMIP